MLNIMPKLNFLKLFGGLKTGQEFHSASTTNPASVTYQTSTSSTSLKFKEGDKTDKPNLAQPNSTATSKNVTNGVSSSSIKNSPVLLSKRGVNCQPTVSPTSVIYTDPKADHKFSQKGKKINGVSQDRLSQNEGSHFQGDLYTHGEVTSERFRTKRIKRRRHRRHRTAPSDTLARASYSSSPSMASDAGGSSYAGSPMLQPKGKISSLERLRKEDGSKGRPPLLRRSTDIELPPAGRSVSTVQLNKKVVPTYFLESVAALPDPHCILGRLGHSLDSQLETQQPQDPTIGTSICVMWDLDAPQEISNSEKSAHWLTPKQFFSSSEDVSSEYFETHESVETSRTEGLRQRPKGIVDGAPQIDNINSRQSSVDDESDFNSEIESKIPTDTLLTLSEMTSPSSWKGESSPSPRKGRRGSRSCPDSPERGFSPNLIYSGMKGFETQHESRGHDSLSLAGGLRRPMLPSISVDSSLGRDYLRYRRDDDLTEEESTHPSLARNHFSRKAAFRGQRAVPLSSPETDVPSGAWRFKRLNRRSADKSLRDSAYFSTTDDCSSECLPRGTRGRYSRNAPVTPHGDTIRELVEKSIHEGLNALPQLIASEVSRQVERCIQSSKQAGSLGNASSRSLDFLMEGDSASSVGGLSPEPPFENSNWPVKHSSSFNNLLDVENTEVLPSLSLEGNVPKAMTMPVIPNIIFDDTCVVEEETSDDDFLNKTRAPIPGGALCLLTVEDHPSDSEHSMEWDYSFLQQEGTWPQVTSLDPPNNCAPPPLGPRNETSP